MLNVYYKKAAALLAEMKQGSVGILRKISMFSSKAFESVAKKKGAAGTVKASLARGTTFILMPFLLVFVLLVILFSKVFPRAYKWISYVMASLRVVFAVLGERRGTKEINFDEVNSTIEFTGFTYDPAQDMFYSNMDAWQRNFGYCRLYDEASAPLGMIIDCEPIYFKYGWKYWLIEFWKGQYDLTTGCEIGIYTTEGPVLNIPGIFNGTFFNSGSNAERLHISYTVKKNDKVLFAREGKHWWLTGFKLGEFSKPSELSMKISITMKDEAMCSAFVKGLNNAGYSNNEISKNGTTVSFTFAKPKSTQPFTRMKATDWIIQRKNKFLCDKYQDITGTCNTLQEKLQALHDKAPKIYKRIINIGKTKRLYEKFKNINNYLN